MIYRPILAILFSIEVALSLDGHAQPQAPDQNKQSLQGGTTTGNPRLVETEVPGVRAFAVPPEDFSITSTSNEELKAYGIPPRPDEDQNPQAYTDWIRKYSKKRILPRLAVNPNIVHATAEIRKVQTKSLSLQNASSLNWSGYVITDSTNMFSTPGTRISAIFPQPKPFSGCTRGPGDYHASFWVGIDGWYSHDVLQVGTELDLNCSSGGGGYGWIEWYDDTNKHPENRITNLPVGPGDLTEAEVWLEVYSPAVSYILYFSAGAQYVMLSLSPPPGVTLIGNCIEWVAERPTVNGTYANLTNYLLMPWFAVNAQVPAKGLQVRPSKLPMTSTLVAVNMDQGSDLDVSSPTLYAGSWPSQWDDGIVFSTKLPY